jgi:hypothetical protein
MGKIADFHQIRYMDLILSGVRGSNAPILSDDNGYLYLWALKMRPSSNLINV